VEVSWDPILEYFPDDGRWGSIERKMGLEARSVENGSGGGLEIILQQTLIMRSLNCAP